MDKYLWPDKEQIMAYVVDNKNILDHKISTQYECVYTEDEDGNPDELFANEGGFGVAFLMKNRFNGEELCFRIWTKDVNIIDPFAKLSERLELITNFLRKARLRYFLKDFTYLPKALNVGSHILPGVSMTWVDGMSLAEYIQENASSPRTIERLADDFLKMCRELRSKGISHGDLSCNNIMIISNGEIRLIDYDSVYVPSMGNKYYQVTAGTRGFQQSYRMANSPKLKASPYDDNFSQQVIYLSLLVICQKPELGEFVDNELLFTQEDFYNEESLIKNPYNVYNKIVAINDDIIQMLLDELRKSITCPYDKVRSIVEIMDSYKPRVVWGAYCGTCGHHYENLVDKFCPDCGKKREIFRS